MIEQRALGSQGLITSSQGLGCMGMSEFYGSTDETESIATIGRALELGVTFLDTAAMYGMGENEKLVGRAVAGRRDEFQIATKFGITRDPETGVPTGVDSSPDYVKQSCEESLQRLGIDTIDLLYQHRVDPATPIEETVGAMAALVEEGKVRFLGLSEASPATIRRANAVHPITALQTEYSLWSREVEDEILPTVRELGIGFVPYSPLGRGFLTGAFKSIDDFEEGDYRSTVSPRMSDGNFDVNLALVEVVEGIAGEKGVTAAQVALAWVHRQGGDITPIPGTKRRKYLEENAAAVEVELSEEDRARLAEAFPVGVAAGERYDPERMRMIAES